MSDESDVLEANRGFYRAFVARDIGAMSELWSREHPVACVHPGWPPLLGRDHVMASWRGVLGNPSSPAVDCVEPTAHLFADSALVICHEVIGDTRLAATNVFVREAAGWRIVHHQATPIAAEADVSSSPDPNALN